MFNRQTWYTGEIVQSTVMEQIQRDVAKTLAQFIMDSYGSNQPFFSGLNASPAISGLTIWIAPGALYQYGQIDPTTWSVLSSDVWEGTLLGLLLQSQSVSGFSAPSVTGQSINYLVEAQIQVTDTAVAPVPFSNGATPPTTVFSNLSPTRQNLIVFRVKAGTAAATGAQTTPAVDSGWVPLWQVQVNQGQTTIPANQITAASGAPQFYGFIPTNPSNTTSPVLLSPTSQQVGVINVSGGITAGTAHTPGNYTDGPGSNGGWLRIGNTSTTPGASGVTEISTTSTLSIGGFTGNLLAVFDRNASVYQPLATMDISGNLGVAGSLSTYGPILNSSGHAGNDSDPYPLSQINATQLGGKSVNDFALAGGNYISVFGGPPTLATGNAGITGTFQANVIQVNAASGTAPLTVSSNTVCVNLNADMIDGYNAGNASGQVAVSNGTLCSNLNAQYLNGKASTAFQLAGNYATMNVTNTGSFTASSTLGSTGGTGSSQILVGYQATNGYRINNGGAMAYVQAVSVPLALLGSSVQTNGPLYVGAPASPQNVNVQDVFSSGLIRSGIPCWRVTRNASYSASPVYLTPGAGGTTDYGVMPMPGGGIYWLGTTQQGGETMSFRMILKLSGAITIPINARACDAFAVYLDGVAKVGPVSGAQEEVGVAFTCPSGTHTLDVVYSHYGSSPNAAQLFLMPFLPYSAGVLSSSVISAING